MNEILLRTFLSIIETGSFNSTADVLGTKQSTVSSRVTRLEEELGVCLFQRGRAGAKLTKEGEQFVEHCEALLSLWGSTKREVASVKRRYGKHLQVVVQPRLSLFSLISGVGEVFQINPEWTVRFDSICTDHIHEHIRKGQSDIAITDTPIESHDIEVLEVCRESYVMYSNTVSSMSDVTNETYTKLCLSSRFNELHQQLLPQLATPKFSVASSDIGIDMVRHYGGSLYLPKGMITLLLKDDERTWRVVSDAPEIDLPLYINVPQSKMRNPKITHMLESLKKSVVAV